MFKFKFFQNCVFFLLKQQEYPFIFHALQVLTSHLLYSIYLYVEKRHLFYLYITAITLFTSISLCLDMALAHISL